MNITSGREYNVRVASRYFKGPELLVDFQEYANIFFDQFTLYIFLFIRFLLIHIPFLFSLFFFLSVSLFVSLSVSLSLCLPL